MSPVLGARLAGLLAGLALVGVVALQAWRVPASAGPAAVDVDVRAVSSGEVGVSPAGRGRLRLTNRTAEALPLRAQVHGGSRELDAAVSVTLSVAGRVVHRGPLSGLRDGVSTSALLPRGGAALAEVRARGPRDAPRWTLTFSGDGSR